MRTSLSWSELLKDRDGTPLCIYDLVYSPDGAQLIVTAGIRVNVYNAGEGTLIQSLKGHKENVLCLAYAKDGKRFASGGADKQIIIWTSKLEGILKYSHGDPIRCMAFNPVSLQLVSCTQSDIGIWSPEQKSVSKQKVTGQINACAWSADGHHLALAFATGFVSIRNRNGEEKTKIERLGGPLAPIWGVSFNPIRESPDELDTLAAVDWAQTLTFYDLTGKQVGKERMLGFDPLCVSHFQNGEYVLIGGSNRQATLYTKDGIHIGVIAELSSWVWACKASPDGTQVAVAGQDGAITVHELVFSTVHSLYNERYAYRENMTDVIIQHLITEEKVRIKCRDLVKKLAIYKNRLAIQLPERTIIYELSKATDTNDMHYKVKEKINQKLDCTLLLVCAENLVLCQEKRLQCYSFSGAMEREWVLDSTIRYLRATGGPVGREGLLVGLKSGLIIQIFINNPFPISVVKIDNPVRCLDLSVMRQKLAVVDDRGGLNLFDARTKQLIWEEKGANSVAFNSQFEDMLAFSGNGQLCIKANNFEPQAQHLQGFVVVGFCGPKVFCLQLNAVSTVEVSLSAPMYQYIEKKMFKEAYRTACLKVTPADWEALGFAALETMELQIARKAFVRLRNWAYLELIQNYMKSTSTHSKTTEIGFLGDVMAYRGSFHEAAKLYRQSNNQEKAINMFTDLRMFEEAQELINRGTDGGGSTTSSQVMINRKKADWIHGSNEPKSAAEMYLQAGDYKRAIDMMGQHGWIDMLMGVVNQLDKGDRVHLNLCAQYLLKHRQYFQAAEVYKKMGDVKNLASIYVKSFQWQDAFKLVDEFPQLKEDVYLPYATWLAERDMFIQAQEAFHKAGKTDEALKVLLQLTENAINENRFNDAGYYNWILSRQCLDLANEAETPEHREYQLERYRRLKRIADIYYIYHNIYRYIEEPFTSFFPDALFNMARWLFHIALTHTPKGVSKVSILYALAKQGRNLGAYKLTRHVYEKLHTLYIPPRFQEAIEIGDVLIRAKPFSDAEELLPLCYRCSTTNPLFNSKGNCCINCGQAFIFSYATFDVLPLVEFKLEPGIPHDEALELLASEDKSGKGGRRRSDIESQSSGPRWQEQTEGNIQSLKIEASPTPDYYSNYDEDDGDDQMNYMGGGGGDSGYQDPFTARFVPGTQGGDGEEDGNLGLTGAVIVNRQVLRRMNLNDVVVVEWPPPLERQYYRNLMPDVQITKCNCCNEFFHSDEFEMQLLQNGQCPYCRNKPQDCQ